MIVYQIYDNRDNAHVTIIRHNLRLIGKMVERKRQNNAFVIWVEVSAVVQINVEEKCS